MSDASKVRNWRELAGLFPRAIPFSIEPYEQSLDSLDHSLRATLEAHGEKTGFSPFGWGDPVIENNYVVRVERRPIAPLLTADATNAFIVTQVRLNLYQHVARCVEQASDPLGVGTIVDEMGRKLLKRRLALSERQFIDLIRSAILPPADPDKEGWDCNLLQIIGLLEKSSNRFDDAGIRKEFYLLANKIERAAVQYVAMQKRLKMKVSTKRLDGARARVLKMAESTPRK